MNNFLPSYFMLIWSCFLLIMGSGNLSTTGTLAGNSILYAAYDSVEASVTNVLINTDSSLIFWKGTEMWKTGKHEGTVTLKEGFLQFENDQIVGGRFIADMNSMYITDIPKHEPVPRRRLRNHLKSEDFFYTERYPTAEFKITKTKLLKEKGLKVWGNLSIRDVTKMISFTASQKSVGKSGLEFNASFEIDRFSWNIAYQGNFWDKITSILDNTLVDADIQLSVKLVTLPAV